MIWHLFLDESGDLGFDFENKDCSRHLTISILAVKQQSGAKVVRNAIKKTLKRKVNSGRKGKKNPQTELKGSSTSINVKRYFYGLIEAQVDFGIYAITLDKQKVDHEICSTPTAKNRLYDSLAKQVIEALKFDHAASSAYLIVDRSKGKREIAKFDTLIKSHLRKRLSDRAKLSIEHSDSKQDLGLSAADLFCWGIFRTRERDDHEWYSLFQEKVVHHEDYKQIKEERALREETPRLCPHDGREHQGRP